jgi:hypothetical protein
LALLEGFAFEATIEVSAGAYRICHALAFSLTPAPTQRPTAKGPRQYAQTKTDH